MINRALTVAFCPSGSCIGTSADTDRDATADAKGESHTRDLLRAVDFYATVLAMASHDLRQPLQVIVRARPEISESTFGGVKHGFTTQSSYHILWW